MSWKLWAAFGVAALIYVGGYVVYRQTNIEVSPHDQRSYVIFPSGTSSGALLYYIWLPLSLIDGALTSTGSHIGPLEKGKGRKRGDVIDRLRQHVAVSPAACRQT